MRFIEVRIQTTQEGIDPLTCILMDMGIAGFAIEDARDFQDLMNRKNTYDWDYIDEQLMEMENMPTAVSFYLEDSEEGRQVLEQLRSILEDLKLKSKTGERDREDCGIDYGTLALESKPVDDSDWKDNWKEYFKPSKITDRIVIKPTWETYEKEGDELVIEIDPGMAFGTGTHPTTSLCVKLLERYLEPECDAVLDVGCGSGILSVAAALLSAKEVLAVDIDPVAVAVTTENAALNGCEAKIRVIQGDLTKGLDFQADIVVANLMADLVMMLSKNVAAHLRGKGFYISSGILISKRDEVAAAIQECGFRILDILEEGEWCAIAAQR